MKRHVAQQFTLPGLALEERTRVVEVAGPQLADTLEAERARGWTCVAMDMAGLSKWKLTLEREAAGNLEPIGSKPATESQAHPLVEERTHTLGQADKESLSPPATGYRRPPPLIYENTKNEKHHMSNRVRHRDSDRTGSQTRRPNRQGPAAGEGRGRAPVL